MPLPYDALSACTPAGTQSAYAYDAQDQLVQEQDEYPGGGFWTGTYAYDALGNRTSLASSSGDETYTYDAEGDRLTSLE